MNVFKNLGGVLVKPIRWVASSLSGERGRKLVDQHSALIQNIVAGYMEEHLFVASRWERLLSQAAPHYTRFVPELLDAGLSVKEANFLAQHIQQKVVLELEGLEKSRKVQEESQ